MKKILIAVFSVILIAGIITGVYFASLDSFTSVDYAVINKTEAKITKIIYKGRKIEIPETIDGYTVTAVGPWAIDANDTAFPDDKPAFFVDMFEGVTLCIPETVKSLDLRAFNSCFEVTKIKVDKDNEYFSNDSEGVLYNKDKTELIQYPLRKTDKSYKTHENTVKIGNYAFFQATYIENVTVSDGVKEIGDQSFFSCYNLKKVSLPEGLEAVGRDAFEWDIEEINIPGGLKIIGDGAFDFSAVPESLILPENLTEISRSIFGRNDTLKKIEIGAKVEKIDFSTFADCKNLDEITVNAENKSFASDGKGAIYNKNMTELLFCANAVMGDFVIPDTVEKIAAGAFKNCVNLKSITVPAGVISIGENAFMNSGIEKIVFAKESTLAQLPTAVFYGCQNLKEVLLPQSLKIIGKGAFDSCEKLTGVEIPSGVEKIESSAFVACESISEISVPASVTSIGKNAFGYNRYRIGAYNGSDAISALDDFRIRCTEGSAAEKYAAENGFETEFIK